MQESVRKAFLEDGAALLKGFLNEEQLGRIREAYDWAIANPSSNAFRLFEGSEQQAHNDNTNPLVRERLENLVADLPIGQMLAELWGSKHVWYFAEEVFLKAGGQGSRTFWHQDTSYFPWGGMHWCNLWISFEAVPKKNSLEIIRSSHRGTRFDGTTFMDPNDPTQPLHGGDAPRLPDVEAERALNPDAYDVLSWATEPGDVVLLHPGSLHGGAPVDTAFPERHTIVLRFFGDDAIFDPLPEHSDAGYPRQGMFFTEELKDLKSGDPFRHPTFRQIL